MAATAIVRVRVDSDVKDEATRILADIGLTPSRAVRLLFARIVAEQTFPSSLLVPNATTIAAMQEGEDGDLPSFASIDELMADLNRTIKRIGQRAGHAANRWIDAKT